MITFLRWLLRIGPPRISPDDAIRLARAEAARRGSGWVEPVEVWQSLTTYVVRTAAGLFGGGAMWIDVDIHDGAIKKVEGPRLR